MPADGTLTSSTIAPDARLDRVTFFASGSNHSGEIRALSYVDGANVGVVADRTVSTGYPTAWAELVRFVNTGRKLFVDSGAFTEVKFNVPPKGQTRLPRPALPFGVPFIDKPLDDIAARHPTAKKGARVKRGHWDTVFRMYREAAAVYGANAYVVAPDCVAHQPESLARLERYASDVGDVWRAGATVLLPVQKGELSMLEFWQRALRALRLDAASIVPAIPMAKDATSYEDLLSFVAAVRPSRIHLLGIAPDAKDDKFTAALKCIRAIMGDACAVSCDACLVMRWVGKANGPGGRPRRLTEQSDFWQEILTLDPEALGATEKERDLYETHVRKLYSMYQAASTYWTRLGLAEVSTHADVELPDDIAGDVREEPWLAPLVRALYAQEARLPTSGPSGRGCGETTYALTLATLVLNRDDEWYDNPATRPHFTRVGKE